MKCPVICHRLQYWPPVCIPFHEYFFHQPQRRLCATWRSDLVQVVEVLPVGRAPGWRTHGFTPRYHHCNVTHRWVDEGTVKYFFEITSTCLRDDLISPARM